MGLLRGTYGRLAARSGMASKHGIAVSGGVIDADYTGEIKVILRNHGDTIHEFKAGDRIAQLIVEKYKHTMPLKSIFWKTQAGELRVSAQPISVPNG